MTFDVGIKFSVETQELINARNALQSLAQAAKELNNNQDKAANAADKLTSANEKAASATEEFASSAGNAGKSTESVEQRLARLKDQLGFLNGGLIQSETGLTKMQAGMMASMKAIGATDAQLKEFAKTFDSFNKIAGSNPFDQSLGGLKALENQFRELSVVNKLTAKGYALTSTQVVNLARDIERLQQVNKQYGKDANSGVAVLEQRYVKEAAAVNNLISKSQQLQQQAILQANAEKVAADAISYLDRESSKLVATNDLLSRGFTQASANALYRYKEALQAAGVSANELKQRLYTLEQDLITKQQMSPFTKMREDMGKMQQDVKHLARAISVQLGDVFISLAGGQNPLLVMIQQGDQIRGALQQAKDAGQDLSKAMQGAFSSMASSFKLVGVAIKDFVADGFNTVAGSMQTVIGRGKELNDINKMLAEGSITPLRAQRLEYVAVANAMQTLRIAALGTAAAIGGVLLLVFVELSKEQDRLAQSLAKTGGYFGATSQEAIALSKSLMDVGVHSGTASKVIEEMAKAGNLGKESFAGIAVAANDAQKYVGIGVDETVKKFSELIKDPIKVLNEFAAQTGMLSQEQIGAVQSMLDLGDAAGAQEAAIKLLQQGYASMTAEAVSGMSSLGIAMADLKSSTSEMWDEFKNSDGAAAGLTAIAFILKSIVSMASAAVFLAKAMTVSFALGKDISIFDSFEQMEAKRKAALDTIAGYEKDHNDFLKRLWSERSQSVGQLTAEQQRQNAVAAEGTQIQSKLKDVIQAGTKANAKEMSKLDFVDAKRLEVIAEKTKGFSDEAKQAFLNSEEGFKTNIALTKLYGEEWEKAQKKVDKASSGSKGPKPKETYKVDRSNELAETKKFYDEQLKQIKDSESKQEASLKQSYDAKLISLGEYYAKQTELSLTSQKEQLAVINESSDKQKAAIQSRMLDHVAAFEKEVKAGGNVVALTDKLEAELANLTRTYGGVTQATDTQTQALQTATDKKFYEFYKELNKNVNESKNALEKFSETVANNAANRQADLDLQRKLLGTYGAEAEALKVSTSATRSYSAEIKKQTDLLKKQDELIAGLRKGREGLTDKAAMDKADQEIIKRLEERAEIEKSLGETTVLAKQDAEQAAIDAVAAYNLKVFQEVRDAISSDLYDAIFEGGSKGADALKNVLKNAFKNFVINAYINPIVGNVVGSVMGAIGMGGGGVGGLISNGVSAYQYGGQFLNWLGLGGSAYALGATGGGLGLAAAAAPTVIGASGAVGAGGYALGATGGGLGLTTGGGLGLAATTAPCLGGGSGAVVGGVILGSGGLGPFGGRGWALAGAGLLLGSGLLGDIFGGGSPNLGGGYIYDKGKGSAYREEGGPERISAEADKMAISMMNNAVKGIDSMFEKLGSSSKVADFWGGYAADEKAGDSAWAGGVLNNGRKFGRQWSKDLNVEGLSPEEAAIRYQEELNKAMLDALKGDTEIPKYISDYLKDIDIWGELEKQSDPEKGSNLLVEYKNKIVGLTGEALQKVMDELNVLITVGDLFEDLGLSLDQFGTDASDSMLALVEASDGLEAFTSKMNSYYQNFYSESERYAMAMKNLNEDFEKAGYTLPNTREEYRRLMEQIDLSTEEGRKQFDFMLDNADRFASLTQPLFEKVLSSAESLTSIFQNALQNANSAAEAASMIQTDFVNAINQSLFDTLTNQISNSIITGVVTPMMNNLVSSSLTASGALTAGGATAGSSIASGGAIAGSTIATGGVAGGTAVATGGISASIAMQVVIEQAKKQIAAFAAIMKDPEIQAMINGIGAGIGSVGADLFNLQGGLGLDRQQQDRAAQEVERQRQEAERQRQEAEREAERQRQEAERAAEAERQRLKKIAEERNGLIRQIWNMEGDINSIREMEILKIDESNRALQRKIWSMEDEAEVAEKVADAYKEAQDFLKNFTDSITDFIYEVRKGQTFANDTSKFVKASYNKQYALALSGNRQALGSITSYAGDLIETIKGSAGSFAEEQTAINRVLSQLGKLPELVTPEQLIIDALKENNELLIDNLLTGFNAIDTNLDGLLTVDELVNSGLATQAGAEAIKSAVDFNGDGMISQQELMVAKTMSLASILETGFNSLDSNIDGLLTFDELKASGLASDSQIRALISRVDANGDGMISKQELANAKLQGIDTRVYDNGSRVVNQVNTSGWNVVDQVNNSGWNVVNEVDRGSVDVVRGTNDTTTAVKEGNGRLLHSGYSLTDYAYLSYILLDAINHRQFRVMTGQDSFEVRSEYNTPSDLVRFAKGGVFTNSIVDSPTPFNMGLMGEAGPEAIMPLERGPDGSLGVKAYSTPIHIESRSTGNSRLAEELSYLREEVAALRIEQRAQASALVSSSNKVAKYTEQNARTTTQWDRDGVPTTRKEVN